MSNYERFTVTLSSPSLWRVTFDNPPINLIDAVMMKELLNLLSEIERDKRVAVVLFDSADPRLLPRPLRHRRRPCRTRRYRDHGGQAPLY